MHQMRRISALFVCLVVAPSTAVAGPLDPPVGPVASTAKPLAEIEPRIAINAANTPGDADSLFKIPQPGSYYLTGNITGVAMKIGIEIASSNVSIDLRGFAVVGVAASLDGIATSIMDPKGVEVRNGSISSWGGDGLDLGVTDAVATGALVERIRSFSNTGRGILPGFSARIVDCTAVQNGGSGIFAFSNCTISGCNASGNGGDGIEGQSGCTFSNCNVWSNTGRGIDSTGASVIQGCTATASGEQGLFGASGSIITGSSARGNTGTGITGAIGVTITGCSAYQNLGGGFSLSTSGTISACTAYDNTGVGILVSNGSSVIGCTARQNTTHGIQLAGSSLALNNSCALNGDGDDGAGILVNGADNRLEGNNCVGADRGIEVSAAGNIIVRNTCSSNTSNWEIAASNKCLVVSGVNAGAISGNSGGVSPGSTDPNANFSY